MRISRVRKTDYRPPSVGRGFPLERECKPRPGAAARPDVWTKMNDNNRASAKAHDLMVAGMSQQVHRAAADDLAKRRASDKKDPVQRWTMDRLAAHLRAIK